MPSGAVKERTRNFSVVDCQVSGHHEHSILLDNVVGGVIRRQWHEDEVLNDRTRPEHAPIDVCPSSSVPVDEVRRVCRRDASEEDLLVARPIARNGSRWSGHVSFSSEDRPARVAVVPFCEVSCRAVDRERSRCQQVLGLAAGKCDCSDYAFETG
jgi:hypothetical protein